MCKTNNGHGQLYIHDQDELNDRITMQAAKKLDRNVMQALLV